MDQCIENAKGIEANRFGDIIGSVKSEVSPVIINGRMYIPVRVIVEELGFNVDWDEQNFTVVIN